MKTIKELLLLFFIAFSVTVNATTEKVYATFKSPSNTNTSWDSANRTFTWTSSSYNQLRNIGLPKGDLSRYKKLVVDCEIVKGNKFRVLLYKGNSNRTFWVENSGVTEFVIKNELGDDYYEYILACDEICLSGSNSGDDVPGEVKVNAVYLETYDDEGRQAHASFESPVNTQTTWDAETRTFTWKMNYSNQLKNIGLPKGNLSRYRKLVIDCDIVSGEKFRILFYKGSSNKTLWVTKSGRTEFVIKDELEKLGDDYNDYISDCSEICLSGSNAASTGEVKVNDVYLETYSDRVVNCEELTKDIYHTWNGAGEDAEIDNKPVYPELNIGTTIKPGNVVYGDGNVYYLNYADISKFSKILFYGTPDISLRVLLNRIADGGSWTELNPTIGEDGMVEVDISSMEYVHLNAIKVNWGSKEGVISKIILFEKEVIIEKPEIELSKSDYHKWDGVGADAEIVNEPVNPELNLGKELSGGGLLYGNGSVYYLNYADLSDCSKIIFEGTVGMKMRLLLNRVEDEGNITEIIQEIGADGTAEVDISEMDYVHLNAVKIPYGSPKGIVDRIFLVKKVFANTTSAGVGTICSPYNLDFTNAENIAAYKAEASDGRINLTRVYNVAAREGVLIRSLNGGAVTEDIPVSATAFDANEGNEFIGTLVDIASQPSEDEEYRYYILSSKTVNGNKVYGFYLANDKKIGAGKAYLRVPLAAAAKYSFFSFDDETTGVEDIELGTTETDSPVYDLFGRKVVNPATGLYIKNGKKFIVK